MIKNGLKTYFKSFAYLFVSLGVLFLALLLGGTMLFRGVLNALGAAASSLNELFGQIHIDGGELLAYVLDYFGEVTSFDLDNMLETLREGGWLGDAVRAYLAENGFDAVQYREAMNAIVGNASADIRRYIVGFYLVVLAGVGGGYMLTKALIRRDAAKSNLLKWLVRNAVDAVLSATVVAFITWLLSKWSPSVLFTTVISSLLFGSISLFEAYVVQGGKKVELKQIVNGKNALVLAALDLITIAITMAIVALVFAVTNAVVALAFGYAMIVLCLIVNSLNAEIYVVEVVAERNKQLSSGGLPKE